MAEKKMKEQELQEALVQMCRSMRISSGLAQRAMEQEAPHFQEELLKLLSDENEIRKRASLNRKMDAAGFPARFSKEDFDGSEVSFPRKCTMNDLMGLGFYERRQNVIMFGRTGTGKTMLSIILGQMLVEAGVSVRFFRTPALISLLLKNSRTGKLEALLERLRKASVLILDEFGYVPYEIEGVRLLFDFISDINWTKSIILNTNTEFSKWATILKDQELTAALLGRLTENASIILFPGQDRRHRNDGTD